MVTTLCEQEFVHASTELMKLILFHLALCSHILKVPFENSGGSGIVYIWIGSETTQEEAIHAEQMGRGMFEVGGVM